MTKRRYLYVSQAVANKMIKDLFSNVDGLPNIKVRFKGNGHIDFHNYDKPLVDLVELIREGVISEDR